MNFPEKSFCTEPPKSKAKSENDKKIEKILSKNFFILFLLI